MFGYIYKTTNNINGMMYIGQHRADKFVGLKYIGSGTILESAVKKYGKENFTVEMIESCNSQDELNDREIYWIDYYDAVESPQYYNICLGGYGCPAPKGENHWNYGRHQTDKVKSKLSDFRTGKICITDGNANLWIDSESDIPDGFKLGMTKKSSWNDSRKIQQSEIIRGRVFIHNSFETKLVPKSELENYLSNGYILGKHPDKVYSGEKSGMYGKSQTQHFREFTSNNTKGRIWINNGIKSARVYESDLPTYLSNGWVIGRIKKTSNP